MFFSKENFRVICTICIFFPLPEDFSKEKIIQKNNKPQIKMSLKTIKQQSTNKISFFF